MWRRYELTASEWNRIKEYLPPEQSGQKGRSRKDNRMVPNGMMWILRTERQRRELPESYGSWQSVYARFRKRQKDRSFEKILRELNPDADMEWFRTANCHSLRQARWCLSCFPSYFVGMILCDCIFQTSPNVSLASDRTRYIVIAFCECSKQAAIRKLETSEANSHQNRAALIFAA